MPLNKRQQLEDFNKPQEGILGQNILIRFLTKVKTLLLIWKIQKIFCTYCRKITLFTWLSTQPSRWLKMGRLVSLENVSMSCSSWIWHPVSVVRAECQNLKEIVNCCLWESHLPLSGTIFPHKRHLERSLESGDSIMVVKFCTSNSPQFTSLTSGRGCIY